MKTKLFISALIVVGANAVACKSTPATGTGGSGGATSSATSTGTTTSATTSTGSKTTTSTNASTTTTTGGLSTCDSIAKCTGDGMTPSSGCLECSVIGTSMTATDGGKCLSSYKAAYGTDAMCTGGQAGVCTYLNCRKTCDPTLMFTTKAQLDCVCTNNATAAPYSLSQCLPYAMQTNPQTCRGALYANMPAYMAYAAAQTCIAQTCAMSCGGGG